MLVGMLPWLLLLELIFYVSWRMQQWLASGGGPGGILNFGESPARRFREGSTGITLVLLACGPQYSK